MNSPDGQLLSMSMWGHAYEDRKVCGVWARRESVAMLHGIVISTYSSEPCGPKLQGILDRAVGSMAARDSRWARGQDWFYSSVLLVMRERREEGEGGRKTAVEDPVGNECLQSGPLGT